MKISRGRTEPCKVGLGGVKNVYIWNWVEPTYQNVQGVNGVSLISYPDTIVFKFETVSSGNTYSESSIEFKGYDQTLNVELKKIGSETHEQIESLHNCTLGVIVEDYNGLFRLMGLRNGVEVESVNIDLGSGKSDFNGYKLNLTAKERYKAPLFTDLNTVGFGVDSGSFFLLGDNFQPLVNNNNDNLTSQ